MEKPETLGSLREKEDLKEFKDVLNITGNYMAIPLFLAFWGADLLYFPQKKWLFLALRLSVIPIFFLTNRLLTKASNRKVAEIAGAFYAISAASIINLIILFIGDPGTLYYAGLNLVAIGGISFLPFSSFFHILTAAGIYLPYYAIVLFLVSDRNQYKTIVINSFFIISTIMICFIIRFFREKSRTAEINARYNLRQELELREQIIREKTDLEKKVEEQTQQLRERAQTLENTLQALKHTQSEFLLQSEKMASLGTLSAGIAHEINNAVNKVSGGMRTIERFLVKVPESQAKMETLEIFSIMNKGVDLVIEIVENLRSYSRPEKGELSQINIHSIVQTVCVILKSKIGRDVQLKLSIPSDMVVLGSHPGMVQLISNLMTNALDSFPDGKGTIEISALVAADSWTLIVADTGTGALSQV